MKKDDPEDLFFFGEICQSNCVPWGRYDEFTGYIIQGWKDSPGHYKAMCDNLAEYVSFTFTTGKNGTKVTGIFAMCISCEHK